MPQKEINQHENDKKWREYEHSKTNSYKPLSQQCGVLDEIRSDSKIPAQQNK